VREFGDVPPFPTDKEGAAAHHRYTPGVHPL
jgi:hypothetical protein